jgi:uncharacterized membrane protein
MRVAPDELLLLCDPDEAGAVARHATERLDAGATGAVVLDATDGWVTRSLIGPEARTAFARLSSLRLPEPGLERRWIQGEVVGLPAKVVVAEARVDALVASMWEASLAARLRERCADLIGAERTAAWDSAR